MDKLGHFTGAGEPLFLKQAPKVLLSSQHDKGSISLS